MVSSQQKEIFRVFDLVSQQKADGFQGLLASVYIVTKKQVVALWWKASIFKQPQEVIVLSMNITWRGERFTVWVMVVKGFVESFCRGLQLQ